MNLKSREKGNNNLIRHQGKVLVNLYGKGTENQMCVCEKAEFEKILSSCAEGELATTVFDLTVDGKKKRAILKEIQYDRITYNVQHLDLMMVEDSSVVTIKVPVHCKGEDRCEGVKQGGILKRIKRYIRIKGALKAIPKRFTIDVASLEMGGLIAVKDVSIDSSLVTKESPDQVLVIVNK